LSVGSRGEHFASRARFSGVTSSKLAQNVITAPDDITAEWLTFVLRAEVKSFDVILSRKLAYSSVHRLKIEHQNADGPRTLFLKLIGDKNTPDTNGYQEVEFYRRVAPRMTSPPIVKCHDAAFIDGRAHLLLEDLFETHSQPAQKTAPTREMSRRAVQALAKAHASCWNGPIAEAGRLDELGLRKFVDDLNEGVERFLRIADLSASQMREYRRMLDAAEVIWGRLTRQDHLTVTHGDMHWWNLLLPNDPSRDSVYILDWQLWHIDLGARDLAFLLALGGFAEPRPEIEEELLRVYHESLDVGDYSWEMLIEDYRWSAIRNLNIPAIFWSQGKHENTWRDALRRAFDSCERLGCRELIS